MWMPNMERVNIREEKEDTTTWELAKAFAEDTRNTHWPPKSYSCTFCRREFRSAQALGGHMNVHRCDQARLQVQVEVHAQAACSMITSPTTSLFYQLATNYSEGDSLPIISRSYVINEFDNQKEAPIEELDLELRLGHTITTKTTTPSNNNVSLVNFR